MSPNEQLQLAIKIILAIAMIVLILKRLLRNAPLGTDEQSEKIPDTKIEHLTITYAIPQREETPLPEGCKRIFRTHIAGVTHCNSDGTRRQSILRKCQIGEEVILIDEPDNKYDPNAIKVCRRNGEQLGYIPAESAVNWPPYCKAFVEGVGCPNPAARPRTMGVLLRIEVYPKPSPTSRPTAGSKSRL
jgi:hypothetical protein